MDGGLTYRVARPDELADVLRLREQVYMQDLGHVPVDTFDTAAYHLIACAADKGIVAALRIVGPHQRPFDFEAHFDLGDLLAQGRQPALIGRLAVRRDYRMVHRSAFVHVGMLKLSVAVARKHGITDFFLYTYPNLIRFYEDALFQLTLFNFPHPDWGLVQLMHLDLLRLASRASEATSEMARLIMQDIESGAGS